MGCSCNVFDKAFSLNEFKSVIKSFKLHSSPGLDQVEYRMISSLPDEYLETLLEIFEALLTAGKIPPS